MLRFFLSLNILFIFYSTFAQDVWLQNHFSPSSGCALSNVETVTVLVNNNSATVIPSNTIQVFYKLDNEPVVSQPLMSILGSGSSWNFSFTQKADLSACGPHVMKVWVSSPGDVNQSNDTLVWNIQNDCPVAPGYVGNDVTVCQGANGGTLSLFGWTNGTISSWESSTDGGVTWTTIPNTTPSHAYNNISQETNFRVQIDGGYCPDAISDMATISVQIPPIPGDILGSDSLCENVATGVLTLVGNTGTVNSWEYSTNNGLTWTTIANTTNTLNYTSLTEPTKYRVLIDGGACQNKYSDTALIYVDPYYPQVTLSGSDSLCITNASGFITAAPPYGPIITWEFSNNQGATWNPLSNNSGILGYANLTQTTYYRLITEGGKCPDGISDTAIVYVQLVPPVPTLGPDANFCASGINGVLDVTGAATPVSQWEASTDGGTTWTPIANTSTTYDYSGQTSTTLYRVLMDGVHCPDYYTNTSLIKLDEVPVMGTLDQSKSVCQYETTNLSLVGSVVDSLIWQYSTDNGLTWINISNSDTIDYTTFPINSDVQFQVVGINGICPPETSNAITITMLPAPVVDAGTDVSIYLGDSVQLNAQSGLVGMWMPGSTLSDSTIADPIATPIVTTDYIYYVIDANLCIGRDTVRVTVMNPDLFNIRNVVTMNGDQFNDYWIISGIEFFPMTSVKVFNQYGKLLYESEDYKNDWGGESNGNKLPNGTYYYIVKKGGTDEEFKGTLTLLGNE